MLNVNVIFIFRNMDSSTYLLRLKPTNNSSVGSSIIHVIENKIKNESSINVTKHYNSHIQQLLIGKFKAMECINLDIEEYLECSRQSN